MPAFAGVLERRGLGASDAERLAIRTAAAAADGQPVRTLRRQELVLSWTGPAEPGGEPLCFVHGRVYAGVDGPDVALRLSAAWRRHGVDALAGLRGDVALLFHDQETGEITLVRDQLGGGSLFWHDDGARLTFASEVRHLLPLLASRPGPDPAAMAHWLAVSGQPEDGTMYEGVHRLPAGSLFRTGGRSGRARTITRWWAPRYKRPIAGSRAEHVADLRVALDGAVRRRCPPGEETAVLLSGGLDSSTVAGLASRLDADRRPRRSYSATFPHHPSIDESTLISTLNRKLGLRGTRVVVQSGSVLAGAAEYIRHWELPPPSPNLFFWFPLLRQAAADGVAGMIDGEGGDELFGLAPYLIADRLRRGRVRAAFALAGSIPGGGPHLTREHLWPFVREFGVKGAAPAWLHRAMRRRRRGEGLHPPYLSPAMANAYEASDVTADWKRLDGPRWWAFHVWATTRNLGLGIAYDHVRRRAVLSGVEARHPLVDVDVVERVLRTPPELAFDTRYSRPLQREVTAGILPDEVRLRPRKSYFDALFHDALAGPDLVVARAVLGPAALVGAYVDLHTVARDLLGSPPPPGGARQDWALRLWRIVTAECWLRAQDGQGLPPELWPVGITPALQVRRVR